MQLKKILVIEDEPIQLDLIVDRLQMSFGGMQIDRAIDLVTAQPLLDSHVYDVIIADLLIGLDNVKDDLLAMSQKHTGSNIIVYTVDPDSYPAHYRENERIYVIDKLKPFESTLRLLLGELLSSTQ